MNYNDFNILSNSEYLTLAEHYQSNINKNTSTDINVIFNLMLSCKNMLFFSNNIKNIKIKNETKNHIDSFEKFLINFELIFSIKQTKINKYKDFNLFEYLETISKLLIELNNYLKIENKKYNKLLIEKTINEISCLNLSLLNILKNINFYYFNFM